MEDEILILLDETEEKMKKNIMSLNRQLRKIRAGQVTASTLEHIVIEYYGTMTPISQLSSISNIDGRTLNIKPWEKTLLNTIEKALIDSELGANPRNNGDTIILTFPQITGERRQQLAQQAKRKGEESKIRLRNIRQDANDQLKNLKKQGVSEDLIKDNEQEVQDLTNKYVRQINSIIAKKEQDILQV